MMLIFRKQFGLPLPSLQSKGFHCPGCKIALDDHGIHLLNCSKISPKAFADNFNRTITHDSTADKIVEILGHKFYHCKARPDGEHTCPILEDGATGRLDIKWVKRGDQGGGTVLADLTIVNPITAGVLLGKPITRGGTLSVARKKKNVKYQNPVSTGLQDTEFKALPFTVYGQFGYIFLGQLIFNIRYAYTIRL